MKKKRILFVGSFIDNAKDGSVGGQMYACKALIQSSLSEEVEWILLDTTGNSVPPPPVFIRSFYAFFRLINFIKLLLLKRPDFTLIFSANGPSVYEKGTMVLFSSLFGIKSIFAPRGGPLINEIKKSRLLNSFLKFVLSKSSYIICQGNFWKDFFQDLIPEIHINKLVVIPNWIDLNNYKYNPVKSNDNNQSSSVFRILFMGWIQRDKGVFDIFNAVSGYTFDSSKIEFVFLGDGPDRIELEEKFNTLGADFSVSFPGWVYGDDKYNHLNQSQIFILPSYAEGMPNSLMEAMASGVASIATNVGAVPDLIQNNQTGILVNTNNPEEIRKAISLLISNDNFRYSLISNARNLIESNHSLDSAVKKFKFIINQ